MEIKKPEMNAICPGLFNMKLNVIHTSNQTWIETRKIALHNAKGKEHQIVHDVVDLMIIVLDSPLQQRRNKSYNIAKLERKMRHNQNHLNTLADLAVLYKNSNLADKAAFIDEKIDIILKSSDPNDIIEKAICVLEQGYAALFEEYTENGLAAQQRLLESLELIKVEQSTAVGQKRDVLCQASNYTMDARRLLFQALNCKNKWQFFLIKIPVWNCWRKGCNILQIRCILRKIQHLKFYYAMACSRMPDIKDAAFNKTSISEKAGDLFWSVIGNLPKDNECFTIYRARSYAYIGHILISANKPSNAYPKYSSLNNDKQFQSLLITPLSSFEYANNELADDEVVLSREGISLWLLFKFGPAQQVEIAECLKAIVIKKDFLTADQIGVSFSGIDYDSCSSLLETTIDGINKSRKSILVLSKDFLTREWRLLKPIITETLQKRSDSLFIIFLEKCDVPSEIDDKNLSSFDFTDDMNIPFEIQLLKLALLEN
ncbi:unnamed protein product [Mytilus coruscus]|uniref:TIR domain-containing protein n=1 Tax=Mytilus coruscus TaxID=42192 RepID=A0A6J8DBZ2_MYTCO|nr:unnamed protein product [Mytilus coruscus]